LNLAAISDGQTVTKGIKKKKKQCSDTVYSLWFAISLNHTLYSVLVEKKNVLRKTVL